MFQSCIMPRKGAAKSCFRSCGFMSTDHLDEGDKCMEDVSIPHVHEKVLEEMIPAPSSACSTASCDVMCSRDSQLSSEDEELAFVRQVSIDDDFCSCCASVSQLELLRNQGDVEEELDEEEERPNLSGKWLLDKVEGDVDAFLVDMQMPAWKRSLAKTLGYGVGKVVVRCEQNGDEFFFGKRLLDPRAWSESTASFAVGQAFKMKEEIGMVSTETSKWDGSTLCFQGIADDTNLAVSVRLSIDERGCFAQEFISCKGHSIFYHFLREA